MGGNIQASVVVTILGPFLLFTLLCGLDFSNTRLCCTFQMIGRRRIVYIFIGAAILIHFSNSKGSALHFFYTHLKNKFNLLKEKTDTTR